MLKRIVTSVFLISLFLINPLSAQKVYLKGRVVDNNNSPVQGAQVELVKANKTQTTDSDGRYSIETVLVSVLKTSMASDMITFQNGVLSFKMSGVQKPVRIDVFDVKGKKINSFVQEISGNGICETKVLSDALPEAVYLVKLQLANSTNVFKVMNIRNKSYSFVTPELYFESSLQK